MSLLRNDAVNRVLLHTTIQALAQGAGGVFVLVFLLKAGVPAPLVLCEQAAMSAGRFVIRPAVLPLARRIGLKGTLTLGALLEAAIFPLLPTVHGPGLPLLSLIAVGSIGSVLYWTSYHAYFAALGDAEHRGGQIGLREAMSAVVNIVAPGIGGWALATAGPAPTFWSVAAVQCLSVLPLLGAPRLPVIDEAPGGFRAARLGAMLLATDGWFSACWYYLWQVALFVTLGEHFAAYGGAVAAAGVLGAVGSLGLGRLIDLGHGRRSVLLAYGVCAGSTLLKAASFGSPGLAVFATAVAAVAPALQVPALMTRVYNLAKASPCPLRFHIATEAGWDTGCTLGCLAAAGLIWAGAPFSAPVLLALGGAGAAALLLTRSYPERLSEAGVSAS